MVGSPVRKERAIVLVSGGIDSGVALAWVRSQGHDPVPLSFAYPGRPKAEERAVAELLSHYGIVRRLTVSVTIPRAAGGSPSNDALAPEGYLPARNLIFYALAAAHAEAHGARYIVGGHHGGDGESFPDASQSFFSELNAILPRALLTYRSHPVEILVPFIRTSKAEVIRLGLKLRVPFERTWSCYRDGSVPCGACTGCAERREAFAKSDVPDPVPQAGQSF